MRARVVRALRPMDAIPVENAVLPGTPDVEYIGGWIELKSEDEWPARPTTPLRLKRFTIEQKMFLFRRVRRGGAAWLLLRVGREWLLFRGDVVNQVGDIPRSELIAIASRIWPKTPSDEELLEAFGGGLNGIKEGAACS